MPQHTVVNFWHTRWRCFFWDEKKSILLHIKQGNFKIFQKNSINFKDFVEWNLHANDLTILMRIHGDLSQFCFCSRAELLDE